MNHIGLSRNAVVAAITVASSLALAAPAHNVCVPNAIGVPTREGPPRWLPWSNTSTPVDTALDDPRWLGATGHSFTLGGARAPLHTRALWATHGGKNYFYLSFIVDLEGLSTADAATPRDLFLGFRRGAPFTNGNADPTDDEYGYVFQFHLTRGGSSGLIAPTHCTSYSSCAEVPGPGTDFWRVFVDRKSVGTCPSGPTTSVAGPAFLSFTGSGPDSAPIGWMTNPDAPDEDAVRFWKLDASQPPLLQNRWAVQLRLPIAAAPGQSLEDGIPPDATFWYQGTAEVSGTGGGPYASIGWWPRELTEPVCVKSSLPNLLVHPQLGDASSGCSACSLDNYSRITRYSGAPPAECDRGLSIDSSNIGAVFNAPAGTDFSTVAPTNLFRAGGVNTVIAQPVNLGTTPITAPLLARFRLASWGSAPWSTPTDTGKWRDMRGAENGRCAAGSLPGCSPVTIQGFVDNNEDGISDTNNKGAITFQWTIGDDATLGASEYCKFGLTPPGGSCSSCSCSGAGALCDATSDPGTQATVGATTSPCVSTNYQHDQCVLVELSAPNGGVNFVRQSAWNNMQFAQMSVVAREALIDARQLPVGKGQKEQDIYMLVMPRNMPKGQSGGGRDGAALVRERAFLHAERRAEPYVKDIAKLSEEDIKRIMDKLKRHHQPPPPLPVPGQPTHGGAVSLKLNIDNLPERYARVARSLVIMPEPDYRQVRKLLVAVASDVKAAELNEAIVQAVGPHDAADIVPTLEIYPFYKPLGVGPTYMPMTAFSMFLSHEGLMNGTMWEIDGAERVGHNIFHMSIPVGMAKKIQVRAQATEATELLAPGNPKWPCSGGCACGGAKNCGLVSQVGNAFPGLLAGLYVALRGRRRKRARTSATPML